MPSVSRSTKLGHSGEPGKIAQRHLVYIAASPRPHYWLTPVAPRANGDSVLGVADLDFKADSFGVESLELSRNLCHATLKVGREP